MDPMSKPQGVPKGPAAGVPALQQGRGLQPAEPPPAPPAPPPPVQAPPAVAELSLHPLAEGPAPKEVHFEPPIKRLQGLLDGAKKAIQTTDDADQRQAEVLKLQQALVNDKELPDEAMATYARDIKQLLGAMHAGAQRVYL